MVTLRKCITASGCIIARAPTLKLSAQPADFFRFGADSKIFNVSIGTAIPAGAPE